MPRTPACDPGAGREAARPDDVLVAARGVRLGTLRVRCPRRGRDLADRGGSPRRRASRASSRAARRPDVHGRSDRPRRGADGRLALSRHGRRDDGRADRAVARARTARRTDARAHGCPALRRLRHLHPGAGGRGGRACGRRRRRLCGARRRRGGSGGLQRFVAQLRAALDGATSQSRATCQASAPASRCSKWPVCESTRSSQASPAFRAAVA